MNLRVMKQVHARIIPVCALLLTTIVKADPGSTKAVHVSEPPALDGEAEAIWSRAPEAPFQGHAENAPATAGQRPPQTGGIRFLWNAGGLYALVRMPHPVDAVDETLRRIRLSLFLDPVGSHQEARRYVVWPFHNDELGSRFVDARTRRDLRPSGLRAAAARQDGTVCIELKFPHAFFLEEGPAAIHSGMTAAMQVVYRGPEFKRDWVKTEAAPWMGNVGYRDIRFAGWPGTQGKTGPKRRGESDPFVNDPMDVLWSGMELLQGRFRLRMPHQSRTLATYSPWNFGWVRTPMMARPTLGDRVILENPLGFYSGGEHPDLDRRYTQLTYESAGRKGYTRLIHGPFHPARCYITTDSEIRFFASTEAMEKVARRSYINHVAVPRWAAVFTDGEMRVKPVIEGSVLLNSGNGSSTRPGWMLFWFAETESEQANDVPLLAILDSSIRRVSVADGIRFHFDESRTDHAVGLLPLFGIRRVAATETLQWARQGRIPDTVLTRIRFWHRASLRLPLDWTHQTAFRKSDQVLQLSSRFEFTPDLFRTGTRPLVLALLPQYLSFEGAPERYGLRNIEDLRYPTYFADLHGVTGQHGYTLDLPVPPVPARHDLINRKLVETHPLGEKYFQKLDTIDPHRFARKTVRRAAARRPYMPHTMPFGFPLDFYFPKGEETTTLFDEIEATYRARTFSETLREQLFPEHKLYPESDATVLYITSPHGCVEPYHNSVHILSDLARFCRGSGRYELYEDHWPFIRHLAAIIWEGGFYEYRYDGGTKLGDTLLGLAEAARRIGDETTLRRVLVRLTLHANTAANFFEGNARAKRNLHWPPRRMSALPDVPVQHHARGGMTPATLEGSRDFSLCWDRSYGQPVFLKKFARRQVRNIEYNLLPKLHSGAPWYDKPTRAPKRIDGTYRRFRVRAMVLREPVQKLDFYLDRLESNTNNRGRVRLYLCMLYRLHQELTASDDS